MISEECKSQEVVTCVRSPRQVVVELGPDLHDGSPGLLGSASHTAPGAGGEDGGRKGELNSDHTLN